MTQKIATHNNHTNITICLAWLSIGISTGTLSWFLENSYFPLAIIRYLSGLSYFLPILVAITATVFFIGYFVDGRFGYLARGDFYNLVKWLQSKLLCTACFFIGLTLISITCYFITDSIHAAKTAIFSTTLTVAFLWIRSSLLKTAVALSAHFPETTM